MKKYWLIGLLLFVGSVQAEHLVGKFEKGTFQQIQNEKLGERHLVMFWSEYCTYCMQEMTMIGELIERGYEVNLTTVSTEPDVSTETIVDLHKEKGLSSVDARQFSDPLVAKIYFDVDKRWRGELPLMFLFEEDGKKIKHFGEVSEEDLVRWLALGKSSQE